MMRWPFFTTADENHFRATIGSLTKQHEYEVQHRRRLERELAELRRDFSALLAVQGLRIVHKATPYFEQAEATIAAKAFEKTLSEASCGSPATNCSACGRSA